MTKLEVKVNNPYSVIIEDDLAKVGKYSKEVLSGDTVAVVTDSNVEKLYLDTVVKSLKAEGFNVVTKVIKAGEENKNFKSYLEIIEFLASSHLTRLDAVLSLGGGVISDMAGFASSTYLRGIKHIIVPTTLLSIIDASIGGKTGIDLESGKNLVGAFHEPSLVFTCLSVLNTLDNENILSGMGEGIKYGLLLGGRCFDILKEGLNKDNFEEFVTLCIKCKVDIVVEDECESGKRKLLNLGHTFGHAIEMVSNLTIPHGVAVALGIDRILEYSSLSGKDIETVKSILENLGIYKYKYDSSKLLDYIKMDKKRVKNDSIDLIVVKKIGDCRIVTTKIEEL